MIISTITICRVTTCGIFTNEFNEYYSYTTIIDVSYLADYTYVVSGDGYAAQNPSALGNAVLGD